jgi:hypothetical protein
MSRVPPALTAPRVSSIAASTAGCAEIIVRAPHRDLGGDAMVEGARKPPAAPLEIGKQTIPPLGMQCVEALSEKALVIHAGPCWSPLLG